MRALRTRWANMKSRHGAELDALQPVITVRDGAKGQPELRLVAGPIDDAAAAARLCATISATGQFCMPTVYDGQRLGLP
jgi:hypothetical protein